jgi:hypothetical protein
MAPKRAASGTTNKKGPPAKKTRKQQRIQDEVLQQVATHLPVTDSSHQSVQDSSVAEAPMELSQVAMLTQRLSSLETQLQAVAQISLQQQENLASQQPPIGHTQEVASQPNLELLTEDQSLSNVPGVNGAIQPHYGPGEHPLQEYSVLGTTLDVRIKSKIIAGNYIELSSLLTKHEDTLALRMSQDGKEIVLGRKDSKAITSIFEWLRLFNIYAAVLSTAKPALGPHLNTLWYALWTFINYILGLIPTSGTTRSSGGSERLMKSIIHGRYCTWVPLLGAPHH